MNSELNQLKTSASVSELALIVMVETLVRDDLKEKAAEIARREKKLVRDELFRDKYWMPGMHRALDDLIMRSGFHHFEASLFKRALERAREEFNRDHPEP